jgi:hypothetical protein
MPSKLIVTGTRQVNWVDLAVGGRSRSAPYSNPCSGLAPTVANPFQRGFELPVAQQDSRIQTRLK